MKKLFFSSLFLIGLLSMLVQAADFVHVQNAIVNRSSTPPIADADVTYLTDPSTMALESSTPPIADHTSSLAWDDLNPAGSVSGYRVYLQDTNTTFVASSANAVRFSTLMGDRPNGTYTVFVTAVSVDGLESPPSEAFRFHWRGARPLAPGKVRVIQ